MKMFRYSIECVLYVQRVRYLQCIGSHELGKQMVEAGVLADDKSLDLEDVEMAF